MESNDTKLIHGDCLEKMKDIPDGSIDMILCDLPYGTTACKWDSVIPFEPLWEQYKRVIKDNGAIVLFANEPFTSALITSNLSMFKYRVTWDKGQGSGFLNAKKMPLTRVEDICIFSISKNGNYTYNPILTDKPLKNIRPIGNAKPRKASTYGCNNGKCSDDYDITRSYPTNLITQFNAKSAECNSLNRVHPTQKPVALLEYLINTYSNEGELVLDNTMGSGSTGVACINTNRKFIGIELDEKYYDISCKRINEAINEKKQSLFK